MCVCSYHSRRTWERGRSSRAGGADTCQASSDGAPPRCCSPCPQRATLRSDSSPRRRSGKRDRVVITDSSGAKRKPCCTVRSVGVGVIHLLYVADILLCCTCEVKSCCCSCRPSLRSQERTVLSRPPVHSLVPSWDMSIQLAPSVWPWNCLQRKSDGIQTFTDIAF